MSLHQFMITNSKKKPTELLDEFKIHLNHVVTTLSNNFLDSYEDLIIKWKSITDSICELLIKIKFYLLLLEIKDKNQTNKYEYERSFNSISSINFNNISHFIQKIFEFANNDLEANNDTILDLTKMYDKNNDSKISSLIDEYKININCIIINGHDQIIIQFKNFINHILLEVLCVVEIIKDVSISSHHW